MDRLEGENRRHGPNEESFPRPLQQFEQFQELKDAIRPICRRNHLKYRIRNLDWLRCYLGIQPSFQLPWRVNCAKDSVRHDNSRQPIRLLHPRKPGIRSSELVVFVYLNCLWGEWLSYCRRPLQYSRHDILTLPEPWLGFYVLSLPVQPANPSIRMLRNYSKKSIKWHLPMCIRYHANCPLPNGAIIKANK